MMTDREIMQQALDALELLSQQPTDSALDYADNAITALQERLAQPEHKPTHPTLQKMWEDYCDKCYKREWVGLTEDEVAQAMYRADAIITGPMQFKFAKEIEAKLKEKLNDK